MKTKSVNYILAILLATAAVLNFQVISANTPEKHAAKNEAVKAADLSRVLSETIEYPSDAMYREIQGTVKVLAVIEPDGSVSGVMVLDDIGGSCAKEVTRAIRKIHFVPFMENGIATRHALVFNVNFLLNK